MSVETELDVDDVTRRMSGALNALKSEFSGLRTGRARASLLDPINVDAYGSKVPISQLASISVPEPRMITVQVWDVTQVQLVEKAIRNSNLGLNPSVDGQLLRIPIPELNEERRREMVRIAAKYAEHARVAVRNVRRDGMEQLKKLEKDGHIGEDEHKAWSVEVQQLTDTTIGEIDDLLSTKDIEITQV